MFNCMFFQHKTPIKKIHLKVLKFLWLYIIIIIIMLLMGGAEYMFFDILMDKKFI